MKSIGHARARVRPLVLAVIVELVLTIACSSTTAGPTIDAAKLEANISADASRTALKLSGVDCPRDRVAKANDRFSCIATVVGGGTLAYDVDIKSDLGDYAYRLGPGQSLDGGEAGRLLTADVNAVGPAFAAAKVICPPIVLAPLAKTVFECTLTLGEFSQTIVVTNEPEKPLDWGFKAK